MKIIRPRLTDFFNIPVTQEQLDFAIPFVDEDIPLYVDPFLLWKSPSMQDTSLHASVLNSFNHLGYMVNTGNESGAIELLKELSECPEVGLGTSKTKKGAKIGNNLAEEILSLFKSIPQIQKNGFTHFETIQMLIDGISKDRISDITCSLIKSFLIDYTIQSSEENKIPLVKTYGLMVYNAKSNIFKKEDVFLPQNPESKQPIIFVPKRWLRYIPWLNYDDYFNSFYIKDIDDKIDKNELGRIKILKYNRENYGTVQSYVEIKEREQKDCFNDPLFKQIPIISAKRKLLELQKLPTGTVDAADKRYENVIVQLFSSVFYPHLDFADSQARTDSGVLIRDLIFYNNKNLPFLEDIYNKYDCRQIVMELKNVKSLDREHVNQLNRYLSESFGRFGILVTRNAPPKNVQKNLIDLWSGQRKCILVLTDADVDLMVNLFESKQRLPIEVINRAFVEFMRKCPS